MACASAASCMPVLTVSVQPLALRMGTNSPEYLTAYYLLLQVRDTRDDVVPSSAADQRSWGSLYVNGALRE